MHQTKIIFFDIDGTLIDMQKKADLRKNTGNAASASGKGCPNLHCNRKISCRTS